MKPNIGKSETAKMYGITTKTLMKWIKPFEDELKSFGYRATQKVFTKKQLTIIYSKLGEP
jgi:hypothetical protein